VLGGFGHVTVKRRELLVVIAAVIAAAAAAAGLCLLRALRTTCAREREKRKGEGEKEQRGFNLFLNLP